jgi:uncharacterized protein (TIGR03437 family)
MSRATIGSAILWPQASRQFRFVLPVGLFLACNLLAQAPILPSNSIVNNASYSLGANPLAPGSIAAIFGSNLTDGTSCLPPSCRPTFGADGSLGTMMSGAQVTVNGTPVPIFYASPRQLGIQIPTELTGASATVQVSVSGQGSSAQTVSLSAVSPGIFSFSADGKGPGAITHADGSPATSQSPAQPGELVIVYATGLGQTTPTAATGRVPPSASKSVAPVTVIIDGNPVTPDFAGLSGCCAGLNQINFRIPSNTRPGNVCLVLSIAASVGGGNGGGPSDACAVTGNGSVASNEVTVPVQAPAVDVLQHHLNATRNGLYTDPLITRQAAMKTHRDTTFNATLPGPTYAQPLYVNNGPGGKAAFIVATEQDDVLAIDASSGAQIWMSNLGNPVPHSQLPCGDIDPLGITGTPVIDSGARRVYVAAMTTPDGGGTKQHRVFALSLDDGSILPEWPLDVSGITYHGFSFNSSVQNQRGALLLNSGTLYVPYGGHYGDCGDYRGWVIAVPVNNPRSATAWATDARGGGAWSPGGLSSDGHSIFAATGNTFGASAWMGGEAIIRLDPGATFSGNGADYFSPSNWQQLDDGDIDVGGSGPVLIDVPGATPSQLVVSLGKNGVAYLLNRNSLGGVGTGNGIVGEGVQSKRVSAGEISNAAAAYTTSSGTFVVFNSTLGGIGCPGSSGDLVALRIGASSPPTIEVAWCADNQGRGSPMVTTTDGSSQPVVWTAGSESSNRLHAFNGETGELLFAGGGESGQMGTVRRFQTPIAVNGRIVVAGDDGLYVFSTR